MGLFSSIFTFISDECLRNNVALNKPCGQSSVYRDQTEYACDKANDGSFNHLIHTEHGAFPYWWVDLQTSTSVKEVVIHNRQDEYYFRLHNVNVTVGDDLNSLHQCGYHDGPPESIDPLTITCTQEVEGRYVQIMNMDAENTLHVTEVEVYDCWP